MLQYISGLKGLQLRLHLDLGRVARSAPGNGMRLRGNRTALRSLYIPSINLLLSFWSVLHRFFLGIEGDREERALSFGVDHKWGQLHIALAQFKVVLIWGCN